MRIVLLLLSLLILPLVSRSSLFAGDIFMAKTQDLNKIVELDDSDVHQYSKAFAVISSECAKTVNPCEVLTPRSVANTFWLINNIADGDDVKAMNILQGLENRSLANLSQILTAIYDAEILDDPYRLETLGIEGPGSGSMIRALGWINKYIDDRLGRLRCDRTVVGKIIPESLDIGSPWVTYFDFRTSDGTTLPIGYLATALLEDPDRIAADPLAYAGNVKLCVQVDGGSNNAVKLTLLK